MRIYLLSSLLSFTMVIAFIVWNLFCTHTNIYSSQGNDIAYIANYAGHHNSLLLQSKNSWTEFSYGDWDVYGNSKVTSWTGFKSMGIPSQGALGTRKFDWDGETVEAFKQAHNMVGLVPVQVEKNKADKLFQELSLYIKSQEVNGVLNPINNLFFVKHPSPYAAWNTCNNMLIKWLVELGIEVKGNGWAGNFRVIPIKA